MLLRRHHEKPTVAVAEPEAPEAPEVPEVFDPSAHSVDEVLTYLGMSEGHDPVTSEEFIRVIKAEAAGKARKGILDAKAPEDPTES